MNILEHARSLFPFLYFSGSICDYRDCCFRGPNCSNKAFSFPIRFMGIPDFYLIITLTCIWVQNVWNRWSYASQCIFKWFQIGNSSSEKKRDELRRFMGNSGCWSWWPCSLDPDKHVAEFVIAKFFDEGRFASRRATTMTMATLAGAPPGASRKQGGSTRETPRWWVWSW